MQSKIMHADCGIIVLINNDQNTRLSVFKIPRFFFFVKWKLVQHSERRHWSLCSNSCRPLYSVDSHVEVGLLGNEYGRVGSTIQRCVSV